MADLDDGDEDERTPYVCEKLRGKWPASEEPSPKRRKIAGSSHREERPVTIGASAQPRRLQVVLSSSSDDDEQAVPPSPRAVTLPPSMLARAETLERQQMWGAIATTPNSTWVAPTVAARVAPSTIARTATVVPETTWMTPVVAVEAPSSLTAGQIDSWRGHRF